MAQKLFFSQDLIDSWCDGEKVKMEHNVLSIQSGRDTRQYNLKPACRFIKVSDGGPDPHQVTGAVLTADELEQKGADVYLDSCIIGDTAYDVEPGYVARKAEDEKSLDQILSDYLAKTLI